MWVGRKLAGLAATAAIACATLVVVGTAGTGSAAAQSPDKRPAKARVEEPKRPAAPVQAQRSQPRPQVSQNRGGGGNNTGRNVALGVGAAVIGGILLSEAARAERRRERVVVEQGRYEDADDRRQRCDDDFRAFDWDNGTIRNRYGSRVRCPYLRDSD
jgi:hypothetical protein